MGPKQIGARIRDYLAGEQEWRGLKRPRTADGSDPPLTVNITDSICAVGTLDWLGVTVEEAHYERRSAEANATRSASFGLKQKRAAKKAGLNFLGRAP
jgi:hypothetical protein